MVSREGEGRANGSSFSESRRLDTYEEFVDWSYEYGYGDYEGACNSEEWGDYKYKTNSENTSTTDISYDAEARFSKEGNSAANHLIGIGTNACKSGYDHSYDYHWECSGCGGCTEYNDAAADETESESKFLDYDKMATSVGFGQGKAATTQVKYSGFSGNPSMGSTLGAASPNDSGGWGGYYYYGGYYYSGYYYGSYYGGYLYPNAQETGTVSVTEITVGQPNFGKFAEIDVEAILNAPPPATTAVPAAPNPLVGDQYPGSSTAPPQTEKSSSWFSGIVNAVNKVSDKAHTWIENTFFKTEVNPNNEIVRQILAQNKVASETIDGQPLRPYGEHAYEDMKSLGGIVSPGTAFLNGLEQATNTENSTSERLWGAIETALSGGLTIIAAGKNIAKETLQAAKPIIKNADHVVDAGKAAVKQAGAAAQVATTGKGFDSFAKLKEFLGSPGEGKQWHHIVEQSQIKKSDFLPTDIHNELNVIAVDTATHIKISAYYNSIDRRLSGNLRVRDWLAGQSFEYQIEFGKRILKQFGAIK
jgi:hypothetical protein